MRRSVVALVVVALAAVAALAAVGWVFSDRVLVPAPYQLLPEFELVDVTPLGDGAFEVAMPLPAPDADPPQHARTGVEGRYGLLWEDGAGRLGEIVGRADGTIVRRVALTRGSAPKAGDPARMDVTLFADPGDRGLAYQEVLVPGPLGDLPGWWLPGRDEDAIVVFHGRRRADRSEALRMLPTLVDEGASVLVVSYRNHDASPPSPDGFYHYGAGEVDDALAAVAWLAERGVERIALVGYSMGSAVATLALDRWPKEAAEPVGLILDSPLIDPEPIFAQGARRSSLPAPAFLAAVTTRVAGWRTGVDFGSLDLRRLAPEVEVPVLLIAGEADTTIPVATVDAFADALPLLYAYLRLPDVEHVEGWNAVTDRYEEAVAEFLAVVFERTALAEAR